MKRKIHPSSPHRDNTVVSHNFRHCVPNALDQHCPSMRNYESKRGDVVANKVGNDAFQVVPMLPEKSLQSIHSYFECILSWCTPKINKLEISFFKCVNNMKLFLKFYF